MSSQNEKKIKYKILKMNSQVWIKIKTYWMLKDFQDLNLFLNSGVFKRYNYYLLGQNYYNLQTTMQFKTKNILL